MKVTKKNTTQTLEVKYGHNALARQHDRQYIRVQDVDEQRVVLEEVVDLEAAAVADSEISKTFAVVGCG